MNGYMDLRTAQRHNAGGAALGLSCADCFERLAEVFAIRGARLDKMSWEIYL